MKRFLLLACAGVFALGLTMQDAEAKRLGGGASKGMQRDSVTQKQATPPPAQQPSAGQAANAAPSPSAPPAKRNWMGPLAGLAAGLGIAALLSHFGLGEGMANILMIALLAMAAVFVFRLLFRKRQPDRGPLSEPMQYAGVGGPGMAPAKEVIFQPPAAVGANVASTATPVARAVPGDFDQEGFLRIAKVNFIRLQAANDAGNLEDIREFTTPEMFGEISLDFSDRHGRVQTTDVVTLEAELLEVVSEATRHIASVRFHGMIREENDSAAQAFDEVWNLVKPIDGSRGWAVAGIQQLG